MPKVTWFGRAGTTQADIKRDYFYSGGLQFANGAGFYPGDFWGVGYAHYDTGAGPKEILAEGYYNFGISEKFRLSFHLTGDTKIKRGWPSIDVAYHGFAAGRISREAGWPDTTAVEMRWRGCWQTRSRVPRCALRYLWRWTSSLRNFRYWTKNTTLDDSYGHSAEKS